MEDESAAVVDEEKIEEDEDEEEVEGKDSKEDSARTRTPSIKSPAVWLIVFLMDSPVSESISSNK